VDAITSPLRLSADQMAIVAGSGTSAEAAEIVKISILPYWISVQGQR
jgi:hypothetical protein